MDAQSKENTDIITTQKRPITGCIISIEGDIMIVIAKDHVPSLIHVPTGTLCLQQGKARVCCVLCALVCWESVCCDA